MNRYLARKLQDVGTRFRRLHAYRANAWVLGMSALLGFLLWLSRGAWTAPMPWIVVAWLAATSVVLYRVGRTVRRVGRDPRWIARRIEAVSPDLDARLLTAVDLELKAKDGKRSFLHYRLMEEVIAQAAQANWSESVPDRRLLEGRRLLVAATAAFCMVAVLLVASPGSFLRRMAGVDPAPPRSRAFAFEVDPGHVELERGTGLLVLARFEGPAPAGASLVLTNASGASELAMSRSLDDPVYGVRIPRVLEDGRYRVVCGGVASEPYRITVFDAPGLVRADARLVYPDYTGLDPATVVDVRRVGAIEGTELTWMLRLNKPVTEARLVDRDGAAIRLEPGTDDRVVETRLRLEASARYRLHLIDREGRANKTPPELVVRVLPNRTPDIRWVSPGRDILVSALEELRLAATFRDDVGLHRYGLTYTRPGDAPQPVELGRGNGGTERLPAEYLLALEDLGLRPNQMVSLYLWADDTGPDGATRRSYSDMYFAEVRPFDEVFREGQAQPGGAQPQQEQQGQAGAARAAGELLEIQKQIVNGTWNLMRGTGEDVVETSGVLLDAQRTALQQAEAMEQELRDPESLTHLQDVVDHMGEAIEHLDEASEEASLAPLAPALGAEQSAYQALLNLQAREFSVAENAGNQDRRGGARGGQSRMQRQLQELQLANDRNRYETQRAAQDPASERSENEEAFDRLRDLARRQSDVNERLKELQSALEEAATREARDEIREELRRLRDQQQRILRDTDALAEQMQQRRNEESMAEARRRLEEIRSNVREAAEAIDEDEVSRAAAEGTRAEEQFRDLGEAFRRRSARQFSEEMERLRGDARDLANRQRQVGERLAEFAEDDAPSLRGEGEREELADELARQQEQLADVLDATRDMVERAEEPEPLLAETLYDAVREAQLAQTEDVLDVTRRLVESGFPRDALEAEALAGDGIRSFRDAVERAAGQVLGDGTEALRRAREELERLAAEAAEEAGRAAAPGTAGEEEDRAVAVRPEGGAPAGEAPEAPAVAAPFGGDDFRSWSDRLGDVEDMIDDPTLQADAARIREQARQLRSEARRGSLEPNWDLVQLTVIEPMYDLRDRVIEEVLRRTSQDDMVPIDTEPVPPVYAEQVQKYYERLGSGE